MSASSHANGRLGVKVLATGSAVPPNKVTNADLEKIVDTSDEWITQRTGIRSRYLVENGQQTSDLAAEAVNTALDRAGLQPKDLDLLLLATMTQDMICPATACQVVQKIDAIPCGALDINIACTGFVAALNLGDAMIRTGHYRHVAVVAADTLSSIVNWDDRRTCVLFGDGAGACILGATDDPRDGCQYQSLASDAKRGEALYVPRTDDDIPSAEKENYNGKLDTLQMNGKVVYKFAVEALAGCVDAAMEKTGLTADDIAMVIPHQSNIRMLKTAWRRLGFDQSKIYINIDRYGNTSAASAGICFDELMQQGDLKPGDNVIFVAQGGGLSWGANVWKL
jgi:3-oxoacyl-[acyl-carrier-protein] synthase-3